MSIARGSGRVEAGDEPAFNRIARLAAKLLDAPVALIALVEAERQVLRGGYGLAAPAATPANRPAGSSRPRIVAAGEALIIADARDDPRAEGLLAIPELGELEIVAYAGVPLLSDEGHLGGMLAVIDQAPRTWSETSIALLRDLALLLVAEAERADAALVAERETEEKARILERITDAFFALDRDWRFTYVNARTARMVRREPADLLGKSVWDELPEMVGSEFWEHCRRAVAEQVPVAFEAYYPPLEIWLDVHAYPSAEGLSVYLQDITRRRRTEEMQQFLVEASALLSSSLDYEATLETLARLAVTSIADWCTVNIVQPDGSIKRLAVAQRDPAKEPLLLELRKAYPLDPASPYGVPAVIRSGRPEIYTEIPREHFDALGSGPEHRRLLEALGVAPALAVPLIARDTTLGAIWFAAPDSRRHYDADDLAAAMELARHAALAIDNARLYQEAQRSAEEARRHASRLQALAEASKVFADASFDVHATLHTIARYVSQALDGVAVVRLLSDDGEDLAPVASYHPDPRVRGLLRGHQTAAFLRLGRELAWRVLEHGEPVLIPDLSSYPEVEMHSVIIVPMRARGWVVGTLSVWRIRAGGPYTPADLSFLQDLADRAGLAVDNTQLYERLAERGRRGAPERERPAPKGRPPALTEPLTPREHQVLQLMARGMTNRQIATHLHVSPSTVKGHVERIIAKLGASDRTEAAVRAAALGLIRQ